MQDSVGVAACPAQKPESAPQPCDNQVLVGEEPKRINTANQFEALGELNGETPDYQSDRSADDGTNDDIRSKSDDESQTTQLVSKRKYRKRIVPPTDRRTRAAGKQSVSNPLN